MINQSFILESVQPFLNQNQDLSAAEFAALFSEYPIEEQETALSILSSAGIHLIDVKENELSEEESAVVDTFISSTDYDNLLALTNEDLVVLAQDRNAHAKDALIHKNRALIYHTANRMAYRFSNSCMTIDDFVQEAVIGMLKAIDKFDPSLNYRFSTYAFYWLNQNMQRQAVNNGYTLRLPAYYYEKNYTVYNIRKQNPDATFSELLHLVCKEVGCSSLRAAEYLTMTDRYQNIMSLDASIDADDEKPELGAFIADTSHASLEEETEKKELHERINQLLADVLQPREAEIIRRRFGFYGGRIYTLDECGKQFHVTKERVRQVEAKALRKLANHPGCASLKLYAS